MSSFLCFCFYKNLQELNGVKDEFLFLESQERRGCFGRLIDGDESANNKRIIESIDR